MTDRQSRSMPAARLVAITGDRPPTAQRRRPEARPALAARRTPEPSAWESDPHVVVVGIEPALRDGIVECLTSEGMLATASGPREDLLTHVRHLRPHLVLLGLGRPAGAAIEACARLRAGGWQGPVILVTSQHDEADCVRGLESGADDYVVLPLSPRELLARCHALLRRVDRPARVAPTELPPLAIGDSVFDPARRRISRGTGERHLTPLEFTILSELVLHPGEPVSRQRLLEVSHGSGKAPLPRSIDTAVMRLRRLVEPDPAHPLYLQTMHGRGYMFLPTGRRGG